MKLPVSYFLVILMAAFASCKAPKEEPPIPAAKMEAVIFDIHLAETYSQGLGDTTGNRFDKNYDSLAVFYASILKHHQLSFDEFNEAMRWYRKHPQQIETLYTHVIDKLNNLKAKEGIKDIDDNSPPWIQQAKDSSKKASAAKDTTLKQNTAPAERANDTALKQFKQPTIQAEP